MAVILRYFSELGYLPGVLRKSSRSLSHLLMSSCEYCNTSVRGSYLEGQLWNADTAAEVGQRGVEEVDETKDRDEVRCYRRHDLDRRNGAARRRFHQVVSWAVDTRHVNTSNILRVHLLKVPIPTRSTWTVYTSAKARLTSAAIWRISMNECPLTTLSIS